ncbi:MAG: hypothetical protein PHN75_07845 [Syntrophales bacterium]|nr:hypothetical protein [Syntrophales bacterium]
MKMQAVKEIAGKWGVDCRVGRTKAAVIKDIQEKEGFTPCFGKKAECGELNCLWREDCLK